MKKRAALLACFIVVTTLSFTSVSVQAQGVKLGFKAGANVYRVDGKSFTDEFKWGYHLGGMAELMWSKHWGIQPEVLFNQSSTQTGYSFDTLYSSLNPGTVKSVKLNQLSIPILLNWHPFSIITFQAGPQFSVLMNKDQNLLQNGKEAFKSGDVSLLGGVQITILSVKIYGRYGLGLTNLNNIDAKDKWKNSGIQIGAAITL